MGKDLNGNELGVGLYQRKDGRYEAKATINGVKIDLYDFNLTKLKAAFKEAKNLNESVDKKFKKRTLDEWFEEWFETYKAPYIKETSIYPLKSRYKSTFGSKIGSMRMKDIMNYHIQSAVSSLLQEGKAISSVREALGMLTKCMESARNNKIISVNPCFDIHVPWQNKQIKRRFLTVNEQERFMQTADSSWYKEMYYVMFNTGLRIGEVGGLKWKDINFKEKCIYVNQALSCNYYKGEKKIKLTTLKTPNSYRKIPFINDVEKMLLTQKEKQDRIRKELGERYRGKDELEDLVFCTSMGSPVTRYVAEKEINKVVEAINFEEAVDSVQENREAIEFEKVYPHALRHTFCSRCFEKGLKPKVVQQLMGHAHYSTTIDIYTHITEETLDEEIAKLVSDATSA